MKSIQVFDPALCCSSGVCGTDVDPKLVQFSADVDWAKQHDIFIVRINLAQQPMVFVDNTIVKGLLERTGETVLPVILLDGEIALAGRYPSRQELSHWTGVKQTAETKSPENACYSGSKCC
jgi:hypothetical protein